MVMYRDWLEILCRVEADRRRLWRAVLTLQGRIFWLQCRAEYIRVEVDRVIREDGVGHGGICGCQGLSGWEDLEKFD